MKSHLRKSKLVALLSFSLIITSFFSSVSLAVTEFVEIARERNYLGGPDESDLKVQQTIQTTAKVKPPEDDESNEGF